jgi:hypothetical protein
MCKSMDAKRQAGLRGDGAVLVLAGPVLIGFWPVMAQSPQSVSSPPSVLAQPVGAAASQRYRSGEVVVRLKGDARGLAVDAMLNWHDAVLQQSSNWDSAQREWPGYPEMSSDAAPAESYRPQMPADWFVPGAAHKKPKADELH